MSKTSARLKTTDGAALPLLSALLLLGAAASERCVGGPCGPVHQVCVTNDPERPDPPPAMMPAFHLMHPTCGENDPVHKDPYRPYLQLSSSSC